MAVPAEFSQIIDVLNGFEGPDAEPVSKTKPEPFPAHLQGAFDLLITAAKTQTDVTPQLAGLTAEDVAILERHVLIRLLDDMADQIAALPPYEDDDSGEILPETAKKYTDILQAARKLQEGITHIAGGQMRKLPGCKISGDIQKDIIHDASSLILKILNDFSRLKEAPLNEADLIADWTGRTDEAKAYFADMAPKEAAERQRLESVLPDLYPAYLALYESIARSHSQRLKQTADIKDHKVLDSLLPAGKVLAHKRFKHHKYSVQVGPLPEGPLQPGVIHFDIEPELIGRFDINMLRLIIYNVIKNPLKINDAIDKEGTKGAISIIVQVRETENKCLEVFVHDTGPGISYDTIRDHQTAIALEKSEQGVALNDLEKALLSAMWRQRVTPFALNKTLLERGQSFAGGTGLGLAMVKDMMNMHHGSVELFDHPKLGASMWLVLPNSATPDDTVGDLKRVQAHKYSRMSQELE